MIRGQRVTQKEKTRKEKSKDQMSGIRKQKHRCVNHRQEKCDVLELHGKAGFT